MPEFRTRLSRHQSSTRPHWFLAYLAFLLWGSLIYAVSFIPPLLVKDFPAPDSYSLFFGLAFLTLFTSLYYFTSKLLISIGTTLLVLFTLLLRLRHLPAGLSFLPLGIYLLIWAYNHFHRPPVVK
jgi:hypothetical protein